MASPLRDRLRYPGLVGPNRSQFEPKPLQKVKALPVEPKLAPIEQQQLRIEAVPLSKMFLPEEYAESYQRDFSPSNTKKIIRDFDERKLTPLTLAERRDGRYAIVDGQHRYRALQHIYGEHSDRPVWCMIARFDSIQDEAMWFRAMNEFVQHPSQRSVFRAREISGDERATRLREIVERHHFKLQTYSGRAKNRSVTPAALLKIMKQHGLDRWDLVEKTMAILDAVVDPSQTVTALVVTGLGSFIAMYEDEPAFDRTRLLQVLSRESVSAIDRDSRALRTISRTSEGTAGRRIILNLYNYKLHGARVLPEK